MSETITKVVEVDRAFASDGTEFIDKFVTNLQDRKDQDEFSKVLETDQFVGVSSAYWGQRPQKPNAVVPEGINGAKSKSNAHEVSRYSTFEVAEPPFNLRKLAQLMEKSTPHASAITSKVAHIAELGWDFAETDTIKDGIAEKEGDAKKKALKKVKKAKIALTKWFESLNDEDDIQEILIKLLVDYYATGNAYLEIGRKASGGVGYIGHVPSVTMRVRSKRDGFVQISNDSLTYFRNFGATNSNPYGGDSSPNEILHLKNYSPISGYYGVPDIVSALPAIAGTQAAVRYNLDFFSNKATPRYVIIIKGAELSSAASRNIAEFFESGVKGTNHRSVIIPLPSGTKEDPVSFEMHPVEAGVQEASFSKYNQANTDTILMAHKTPAGKVGSGGGNLAASRDADKTFKEQISRPMQKRVESRLINRWLKLEQDAFLFKLNELSLTDEDTQSKIHERYLRNQAMMPNEVRAEKGLPAVQGGDEPVKLGAQANAEANAQTKQSRTRDANRSAGATDSAGEGRSTQGEGRTAE